VEGLLGVTTDIRAVLSWSYHTLSAAAAWLFRLLALHPGPQFGVPTAASLAGSPVAQVRPLLAELARAHLMIEHVPGRFTFHDLLRAFATERTRTLDTEAERRAATRRILDHYLLTAHAADTLLRPHRVPIVPAAAAAGVRPEKLASTPQALDWFALEQPALLGAFQLAIAAEMDTHAWQLARTLSTFHLYRGHWHDQIAVQRIVVAAARRLGNRVGQAHAHHDLGHVYACLGRYDDAHAELVHAGELYGQVGNPVGQASAHYLLGFLAGERDNGLDALHHARRCRDLCEQARDPVGQARALNALGLAHTMIGQHREALAYCREAVTLHRELGDHRGEAAALDSRGFIHARLGHRHQFLAWYRQALARLRDVGDRFGEAHTLTNVGEALRSHGDVAAATEAWTEALAILEELNHPTPNRSASSSTK
jgi:tetratricopeptide (TPR) repeat protein